MGKLLSKIWNRFFGKESKFVETIIPAWIIALLMDRGESIRGGFTAASLRNAFALIIASLLVMVVLVWPREYFKDGHNDSWTKFCVFCIFAAILGYITMKLAGLW